MVPSESVLKTCLALKPDAYILLRAVHSSGERLPEVEKVEGEGEAVVAARAARQGILAMEEAAGICCSSDGLHS